MEDNAEESKTSKSNQEKKKPERDSYDHCIVLSKNNKISLFIL